MAEIELKTWAYYAGGWYPSNEQEYAEFGKTSVAASGAYVNSDKYTVLIPIIMPKLENFQKKKKIIVTVGCIKQSATSLTLKGTLTNKGKINTTRAIQGTSIVEASKDFTFSGDYATVTLEFDIEKYTGTDQTLYIWLTGGTTSNFIINKEKDKHSVELTYDTVYTNPTSPSITKSTDIYTPNAELTVNWSGGGGSSSVSISSYTLKIRKGSATGTAIHTISKISKDAKSQTINLGNLSTTFLGGDILYASIQAIGSINGYNGSENTNQVGRINTPPNAPTYNVSGTSVDSSNTITFDITSPNTDSDNQGLSFYYELNNDNNKIKITNKTLTINHQTNGISSGSNKIVFYAHDGFEYSTASTPRTFNAVTKLEINDIEAEHTGFTDMLGNTNLSTATKITLNMKSGTPRAIKLYVRTGSTSNLSNKTEYEVTSGFSYDSNTKTVNIPDVGSISEEIKPGHYFQFRLVAVDGGIESDFSNWIDTKRRPYAPRLPKYNNYDLGITEGMTVINGYYKNKITVNYSNEISANGYAKIKLLEIVANHDNASSQSYTCNYTSDQSSVVLNLEQINENTKTSFIFRITDEAGQTVTSQDPLFILTKSSKLAFIGSVVDVSQKNLKPLSNNANFIIYHSYASASGVERKDIKYEYRIKLGDKEKQITDYDLDKSIPEQIGVVILNEVINDLALSLVPNQNSYFDTTITITAKDGFGDTQSKSVVFKIDFTEPPYFTATNPEFKVKHDYYTNNTTATKSMGTEITSGSPLYLRMVNSGEGIIFVLPRAADPNEDIKEYQIYLARNDLTEGGSVKGSDSVQYNQHLISIPYETLTGNADGYDDDYYYYRYTASTYTKNEYFYFKVRVVDKAGNASKDLICPNYLIGCRTVAPTFSASNVSAERDGDNVTIKFNFMITDLGGSATKDGWKRSYYDNYPNFERPITNYEPKATLLIEIAPNQDFSNGVISNENNLIIFTPDGTKPSQADFVANYSQTGLVFKNFGSQKDKPKVFMRFTLKVSYGLKDSQGTLATITSTPRVYSYFGSVPTMAHRAHKIGINTTILDQDDVFVVENYQGTKYVVFKGTDPTNAANSYEVRIDLLEGKLYGYKTQGENKTPFLKIENATIDGGSW